MRLKIYLALLTLLTIFLMLSTTAYAAEGVLVRARTVGMDINATSEVAIIDITLNKTGNVKYIEWYYSKNETGDYNRDIKVLHFNQTVNKNVIILSIKRPLDPSGRPYSVIRALLLVNDEIMLNSIFESEDTLRQEKQQEGQSRIPGFSAILLIISTLSAIYISKKRDR